MLPPLRQVGGGSMNELQRRDLIESFTGVRLEEACERCHGLGRRSYPSTSTWRGGIGGQMITEDVCDSCWGSGSRLRKGADPRRIALHSRWRTLKDVVKAICAEECAPEAGKLFKDGEDFFHEWADGNASHCGATAVLRIVAEDFGADAVKSISPRGWVEGA